MPPFVLKILTNKSTLIFLVIAIVFGTLLFKLNRAEKTILKQRVLIAQQTAAVGIQNAEIASMARKTKHAESLMIVAAQDAELIRRTTAAKIAELQARPIPRDCNEAIQWAADIAQTQKRW